MARYVVTELEGFLLPAQNVPGISCMVVDTLVNHRVVATFRSETRIPLGRSGYSGLAGSRMRGRAEARAEARRLADHLNRG